MASSTRSRNWMFTINNPDDIDLPKSWDYTFLAYQLEEAPGTGTPHLQGYVIWPSKLRLSSCRTISTGHWEPRRATHKKALEYVTKEDTRIDGPWQMGVAPTPGRRTDILAVKDMIDSGATQLEVADELFPCWVRHYKGFALYRKMKTTPRDWKTTVIVLYGPAGTGKTYAARDLPGAVDMITAPQGTMWFDEYQGAPTVILDEFYGWISHSKMLQLMDEYPCEVPVKHSFRTWKPRLMIITSNIPPWEWYTDHWIKRPATMKAFARRLTKIYYCPMLGITQEKEFDFSPAPARHPTFSPY